MGIADGRWRLAENALFATKGVVRMGCGAYHATMVSMPNCGKATWRDARPVLAKLYLMQASVLGERWMLGPLGFA